MPFQKTGQTEARFHLTSLSMFFFFKNRLFQPPYECYK
jgi:hypothetical protein